MNRIIESAKTIEYFITTAFKTVAVYKKPDIKDEVLAGSTILGIGLSSFTGELEMQTANSCSR